MALANRGQSGWFLTVTVIDQQADTSTLTYEIEAADAAAAVASRDAIVAELANRTLSVVKTTSLSFIQDENALVIPTNGADNSVKASITWAKVGGGYADQQIPAPVADTWVAASGTNNNIVNGASFGTWAALFGVGGSAYISDGEKITATPFVSGERVTARRGRRRR